MPIAYTPDEPTSTVFIGIDVPNTMLPLLFGTLSSYADPEDWEQQGSMTVAECLQYLESWQYPMSIIIADNGIPTGGSAGQVLAKIDGADYNVRWENPTLSPPGGLAYVENIAELQPYTMWVAPYPEYTLPYEVLTNGIIDPVPYMLDETLGFLNTEGYLAFAFDFGNPAYALHADIFGYRQHAESVYAPYELAVYASDDGNTFDLCASSTPYLAGTEDRKYHIRTNIPADPPHRYWVISPFVSNGNSGVTSLFEVQLWGIRNFAPLPPYFMAQRKSPLSPESKIPATLVVPKNIPPSQREKE